MNLLTKFILFTHRILGTALSILFFVWFVSGLVMIYHTFPKVSQQEKLSKMEFLTPEGLPSIPEIEKRLPEGEQIKNLTLNRNLGQTTFHIQTESNRYDLPADSLQSLPAVDWQRIQKVASLWCTAPIHKVDSMHRLDQWIPFGRLKEEFPIYKFHYADPEEHQLYISSKSGEVLQFTDKKSRFWAWVGAIPHWVYFTSLRQDAERWVDVVVWLSGIGCVMCIAGIYLGIRDFRLARLRKKGISPYKKTWYKWHHIAGTLFGLFVLTFTFSGMMSLARVQDWGIHSKLDINPDKEMRNLAPHPDSYSLDYRAAIATYPNKIRQLEWSRFATLPLYTLKTDSGTLVLDASSAILTPLKLNKDYILPVIKRIHGENASIKAELLNEYDTYYISRKREMQLPVWKIAVSDADKSCYYINPATGHYRYVNTPARWHHWMYPALHSLTLKCLVERPFLWNLVMWSVMLGGTMVSLSGIWLSIRYILRKTNLIIRRLL